MAICNIFRALTKETGNFLMFSQYSNDLTRGYIQHESYRVVPSRFIAFDIDYSKLFKSAAAVGKKYNDDLNYFVPNYLQDYFENGCSYLSHELDDYTPETSSALFWNAMIDGQLLSPVKYDVHWGKETDGEVSTGSYLVFEEMKYVGDINIHTHEVKDGIGYGEVYCYIPNDACSTLYKISTTGNTSSSYTYTGEYIEGYDSESQTIDGMLDLSVPEAGINYDTTIHYTHPGSSDFEEGTLETRKTYDYKSHYTSVTAEKSFKFNTIVVLYNIETQNTGGSWSTTYKNIPMGMYITGLINSDGTVNNTVTKYDELLDAYNSGTSYGLRICTRFMTTPNSTTIRSVSIDTGEQYAGFAEAMNKMSESQTKMDNLLEQVVGDTQDIKDHLAIFKNSQTNIPYLRKIGNTNYWFVNGRNTGVAATTEESVLNSLNPGIIDARLRLGNNWFNQPFRIHGQGIKTTDEVRLYRDVVGTSRWYDQKTKSHHHKTVKGWHQLTKIYNEEKLGMISIQPYLIKATDVSTNNWVNNPQKDEVEICVRVPDKSYDNNLYQFFIDHFITNGVKKFINPHTQTTYWLSTINIRHGKRRTKIAETLSLADDAEEYDDLIPSGSYANGSRLVRWAIRIFRDGKPITDLLPFKWIVITTNDVSTSYKEGKWNEKIRSELEGGDLNITAVTDNVKR